MKNSLLIISRFVPSITYSSQEANMASVRVVPNYINAIFSYFLWVQTYFKPVTIACGNKGYLALYTILQE